MQGKKELLRNWGAGEIRDAIKLTGVTIKDLADEWDVPVGSLYNAMSGDRLWGIKKMLAEYLGVSVEDMFAAILVERQEKELRRARALSEARAICTRRVA